MFLYKNWKSYQYFQFHKYSWTNDIILFKYITKELKFQFSTDMKYNSLKYFFCFLRIYNNIMMMIDISIQRLSVPLSKINKIYIGHYQKK